MCLTTWYPAREASLWDAVELPVGTKCFTEKGLEDCSLALFHVQSMLSGLPGSERPEFKLPPPWTEPQPAQQTGSQPVGHDPLRIK